MPNGELRSVSASVQDGIRNESGWERAIEAADPASLLYIISHRLGDLSGLLTADDVLQDTLLRAWRSRETFEWTGPRAFRGWLLTLAERILADHRDHFLAAKRGGGRVKSAGDIGGDDLLAGLKPDSRTPSRIAMYHERADLIRTAIESLPEEVREIARLRIVEQRSLREVAESLSLPISTIQHRVRRAATLYQERLRSALASRVSVSALKSPADAVSGVDGEVDGRVGPERR